METRDRREIGAAAHDRTPAIAIADPASRRYGPGEAGGAYDGIDQNEKRPLYAREGVSHLWFVDPDARTLEAFELREGHWVLLATLADAAPVSQPPFDAITFPLDALWPEGAAPGGADPESGAGENG